MFRARLEKTGGFKKLIDVIKNLTSDAVFHFTDAGMECMSMDSSHVCMCICRLSRTDFAEYSWSTLCTAGINLDNLQKVLKCATNDDEMVLSLDSGADKMSIQFKNKTKCLEFAFKLVTICEDELEIPEMMFDEEINLDYQLFKTTINDLAQLGDYCSIGIEPGTMAFSMKSDIADVNVKIDCKTSSSLSLDFSLKFLSLFSKYNAAGNESLTLCFSKEMPLQVMFTLSPQSYLKFYLAPKIPEE